MSDIGPKARKVMREYGHRELHSGSKRGPTVCDPKQAFAIAMSEQREADRGKTKRGSGRSSRRGSR